MLEFSETGGGSGGSVARGESGLPLGREAAMERRSVNKGWLGQRFPTRVPRNELVERIKRQGDVTLVERLTLSVFQGLESNDPRRVGNSERCALAMEVANQRDEHHADGQLVQHNMDINIDYRRNRLVAIAERLGITGMVIADFRRPH